MGCFGEVTVIFHVLQHGKVDGACILVLIIHQTYLLGGGDRRPCILSVA